MNVKCLFFARYSPYLNVENLNKNPKMQNFTKILLLGVALFLTERQTDGRTKMTRLVVYFRSCFLKLCKYMIKFWRHKVN
jgi:hypothetical protein